MKNQFQDGGFADRIIPWITSVLVIGLAVRAVAGHHSGLAKTLAVAAAIVVVGRSILDIVRQGRK